MNEGVATTQRKTMTLELSLGDFAAGLLREEATRQGVPIEELAVHALMYYLADADSGRSAWPAPRIPRVNS